MQINQLNLASNDYEKWRQLLLSTGLHPEENLDETWGLFESGKLIATGSRQGNILKCMAVAPEHQGGKAFDLIIAQLLQSIWDYQSIKRDQMKAITASEDIDSDITPLIEVPGWDSVFVYTTAASAQAFSWFGFEILGSVGSQLIFLERSGESGGLQSYLKFLTDRTNDWLKKRTDSGFNVPTASSGDQQPISSIVMHANPFTLGHLYLTELAAEESRLVHLFILSEESPAFPSTDRWRVVENATDHIENLIIHPTGPYLVSSATFPSYFLPTEDKITTLQAQLDAKIFRRYIAPALSIQRRYLGTEPLSETTRIYNEAMQSVFRDELDLVIVPRLQSDNGQPISASRVRKLYEEGSWQELAELVPETTFAYLKEHSMESKPDND